MSIITAIQEGSEKTFTEVYYQYHVKLYAYFLKKTRSEEIATELVQVVFIKLWNFKHTLTENCSFDTQIFNIARTSLIDFIRQQAAQRSRLTSFQQHTNLNLPVDQESNFETADYFTTAIKILPPIRKKVFMLSRLQGLSYKEIAQHLSITVNTVEDHMTKAIRQIKTIITFFLFFITGACVILS